MDEISNTSKYSTKNKQIIDIDIITHSFKKRNRSTLIDTQTAINQNITFINGIT